MFVVLQGGLIVEVEICRASDSVERGAVALAPKSAIAQINLGRLLASGAQWDEAIEHYQTADSLVRSVRPDLQADELLPQITAGLAMAQSHGAR